MLNLRVFLFVTVACLLGVVMSAGVGQEPKKPTGYWAFVDVTEISQPDHDKKVHNFYPATITGKRGDLQVTFSAVDQNGKAHWTSRGHWTWQDPPGVLLPGEFLTLRVTGSPHEEVNRGSLCVDISRFQQQWNTSAATRFYPRNFLENDGVTFKMGFSPAESYSLTTRGLQKKPDEFVNQMEVDFVAKVGRYPGLSKRPGAEGEWISLRAGVFHGRWRTYYYNYKWVEGAPPPGGIKVPPANGGSGTTNPPNSGTTNPPDAVPEPAKTNKFTVQAGVRRAKSGEFVQVPVYLLNPGGVGNLNTTVSYSSSIATAEGKPLRGNVLGSSLFEANTAEAGIARVGFAGSKPLADSGILAHISFKAVGKPGDRTILKVAVTTANSSDGQPMTAETIDGEVIIVGEGGKIPGDHDGDGVITASDALSALKMSVKLIPENMNLDMDKDAKVTSNDARLILLKAVGK